MAVFGVLMRVVIHVDGWVRYRFTHSMHNERGRRTRFNYAGSGERSQPRAMTMAATTARAPLINNAGRIPSRLAETPVNRPPSAIPPRRTSIYRLTVRPRRCGDAGA